MKLSLMSQIKLSLLFLCLTGLFAISTSTRVARQNKVVGEFQLEPRRARVSPGGSVSILGRTGTPLQFCHFYLPGATGRLVDLSQGHASPSTAHHEYAGAGLQSGECGILIKQAEGEDDGIVECKVKPFGGGQWERSVTTLRVTDLPAESLPVFSIVPQKAVLSLGESLTVSCNANSPITLCHIYLPGGRFLNYDRGADSEKAVDAEYNGSGLEDGECGVTLSTAQQRRLDGYVVCKVGHWPNDLSGPWETDALHITTTTNKVPNVVRLTTRPDVQPSSTPTPPINTPFPACPALTSSTLLISCSFAGEETDCTQPQDVGTTASLGCKPGYSRVGTELYTGVICKKGGRWDRGLFTCVPDCGRRGSSTGDDTLIFDRQRSRVGEFPWNVGVYTQQGKTLRQGCGGSLIAPNYVISAAQCFWDKSTSKVRNKGEYRIVAGRHNRNLKETEPGTQVREVSAIFVPDSFNGRVANIAIVRLATPFEVTSSVSSVCVDWDNQLEDRQLTLGMSGVMAGWGFTRRGEQSDTLMFHTLPYVPLSTCRGAVVPRLASYLTLDKFCAGFHNRSIESCGGDSGGGLVFKRVDTGRFYLRGVSAVTFPNPGGSPPCQSTNITGFTKLSVYREWVAEHLHF